MPALSLRLRYCVIESALSCAMCVIVLEWVRKGYLTAGRFPGASFSGLEVGDNAALLGEKKGSRRMLRGRLWERGAPRRGDDGKRAARGDKSRGRRGENGGYGSGREALAR